MFRVEDCVLLTKQFSVVSALNAPGTLGGGNKPQKLVAPALMRLAGTTLSAPPEEKTQRPVPSALPVLGSNTIPCCNWTILPSVVHTLIGAPAALKSGAPSAELKSPWR